MKITQFPLAQRRSAALAMTLACAFCSAAFAQNVSTEATAPAARTNETAFNLKSAFEAAWQRQPEAVSANARRDSANARREIANGWFPEPAALEVSAKSDRLNANQGDQEYAVGVAVPLWLPGEAQRSAALADAQARAVSARVAAAMLRTAGMVRDSFWAWERARLDLALARERLQNAQTLATDVTRRLRAGDLARADSFQAEGAVAAAQSAVAESQGALAQAAQHLIALTGTAPQALATLAPEPMPEAAASISDPSSTHATAADIRAQLDAAKRTAELAQTQRRANPELTIGTARARGALGEPFRQTFTIGVRWPLGAAAANRSKLASANADLLELESQDRQSRETLRAEFDAAKQRVAAKSQQLDAAALRAKLTSETRGFYEKSFRAGETDFPTRLRIELEATDAERQAARSRVEYAAAVSSLRQALGLLPE